MYISNEEKFTMCLSTLPDQDNAEMLIIDCPGGFCGQTISFFFKKNSFIDVPMPMCPTHKQDALQAKFVPCTHQLLGS